MNPSKEQLIKEPQDERLIQLEAQMQEKITLLDTLTQSIYQQSSEEIICTIQQRIHEVKRELEHLWHQQFLIEQEIEAQTPYPVMRCA